MSTSGSFVPASVPECPYDPRMTRAQALALRAAGGLRENCVVVLHTDTPVIGTSGNTSPTEIELNPVGPTEFGVTARVHTAFAASAWTGRYDIDLGAAGSIIELRDGWGNVVTDPDADSPTVHSQFPWHKTGSAFRDNLVDDATLTGWDAATLTNCSGNVVRRSTVNLTGATFWGNNTVTGGGTVSMLSTGGATRTMANTSVTDGAIFRDLAGGSGLRTIGECTLADGYVVEIAATQTGTVILDGSTFTGHAAATADLSAAGAASVSFNDCESKAPAIGAAVQYTLTGGAGAVAFTDLDNVGGRITVTGTSTGNVTYTRVRLADTVLTHSQVGTPFTALDTEFLGRGGNASEDCLFAGSPTSVQINRSKITMGVRTIRALDISGAGGAVSLEACRMTNGSVFRDPAATAPLQLSTSDIMGPESGVNPGIRQTANATGGGLVVQASSRLSDVGILQNGPGALALQAVVGSGTFTISPGATRGFTAVNVSCQALNVVQNGTGSTGMDTLRQSMANRSDINLNSTLAGTPNQDIGNGISMVFGTLNVADGAGVAAVQSTVIHGESTLNVQPGGQVIASRIGSRSQVSTGAFLVDSTEVSGNMVKIATAPNVGRLANPGFDNWI
ncbi:hypothetical protein [Kitasatospora aureofaciens]|uniref:hypothetical protein n=1 Tax=Kitasatospora aureofaciens TaxID=1894 RepID=UPI0033F3E789